MSAADPADQSSAARATASAPVRQIVVESSQRPVNVAAPGTGRPISLVSNPRGRLGERSPCSPPIVGGWEDQAARVGSVRKSFPQPLIVNGACVAAMIDHSSTWFA